MTKNEFVDYLFRRASQLQLSKAELARRMGCNPASLSNITSGTRNIGDEFLADLAKALKINYSVEYKIND